MTDVPEIAVVEAETPFGNVWVVVTEKRALAFSGRDWAERVASVRQYREKGLPEARDLVV